jgi:hypothetical protein
MTEREYEANDISLTISTDFSTYHRAIRPTILNLTRRKVNGTYDANLAKKAWLNVVEWGLKNTEYYKKNPIRVNLELRRLAAKYLNEEWEAELKETYQKMLKLKKAGKAWSLKE